MTGGRSKRRKTTVGAAAVGGSAASEKPVSPSQSSVDSMLMAAPLVAPGVDLYAQARKALVERCPFDSEEAVPRFGTLPSALAVNLHKKSDGRRKHRKVQEVAAGKSVGPVRPLPASNVWEKTEEYFRPLTLDDIDLLVPRLPPDNCFYLPGSEKLLEEAVMDEPVLDKSAPGEKDVASSSVVIVSEKENAEAEMVQPMQIDGEVTCSTAFPVEDSEAKDQNSLNWILGCKKRYLLTSGRRSSKKKLLHTDTGLEQLFLLPRTEPAEASLTLCDFCCSGDSDMKSNKLLFCDTCKVSVHQKCYGVNEVLSGGWLCSWCKHKRNADDYSSSFPCLLCPQSGGALKPTAGNLEGSKEKNFNHLFCSLWTPGAYVGDVGAMEPVMNVEDLQEPQRKLVCNLCKVKHGVCVRCSHGTCRTSFHPVCGRAAKIRMEIWGKIGHDNVELRVFCLKHSPVHNNNAIGSEEIPSRISDDVVVPELLPTSVPIKRLPKIKITSKGKDKQKLALELGTEGGDVQPNKIHDVVPDNGNALRSASDVITILRKIIDRRKINIGDVALELGVSSASLESSMMGDDTSVPSELRLKIIQWLQNFAHIQPSTCHLKSRNGGDRMTEDTTRLPEVGDTPFVQPSCSINNNEHDLMGDSALTSSGDVFHQDNSNRKFVADAGVPNNCMNGMVTDTNGSVSGNIEGRHLTELDVAETDPGNVTRFVDSAVSGEPLYVGSDNKRGVGVENNQLFDSGITHRKIDGLKLPDCDGHSVSNLNKQDTELHTWSYIHPFILKKLSELRFQWNLLGKEDKLDQLENRANVSPTDEVEGELLYLQNCLLDRATSIKHSCEELISRIMNHLPQELDTFRRKSWDMVLVSQYLHEVKEAKKRGRKERRHTEAQAVLAAATAAAAASRTSTLRKDAIDGISPSLQNLPKNSTTRRVTVHSQPVPRARETASRSSVAKVSSEKHSGDFKFPDFAKENALFCDVCWRTETIVNRIFVCSSCKVAVHLDCYRRLKDPTGPWRCELCEDSSFQCGSPRNQQLGSNEKSYSRAMCSLCGGVSGAFRKTSDGEWVHAFCAEWLLESTYKRGQQNLVGGMESVTKEKDANTCCICNNRLGLCLKCSYGHCQSKFHPSCARNVGLFLNIKAIGGRFQHKAYCEKHSVDQREKVDSQHGAEELKSIKQVRVDLEKLRLLCERIIKREKVKRDLVVCSHGILASRRDCVAFSAMVRSSFTPGISSESATTSIDNPSYSGAMQRSDEITFDSTIHGRNFSRLQMDVDRKIDDSSMLRLSNKKKIVTRSAFSGKQLPQRPPACVSNIGDGGEIKLKDRKGMKGLEKEKIMTSQQASLQNQRLPKGFVYVPVGSLQKDASAAAHDSEFYDLQEPGG